MLLALTQWLRTGTCARSNVFQYITLRALARDAHRARDLAARGAAGDSQAHPSRSARPFATTVTIHPHQGGHADHGGALVAAFHLSPRSCGGDLTQPVRLGRARGTFGFGAIGWSTTTKVVTDNPKASPKAKILLADR